MALPLLGFRNFILLEIVWRYFAEARYQRTSDLRSASTQVATLRTRQRDMYAQEALPHVVSQLEPALAQSLATDFRYMETT